MAWRSAWIELLNRWSRPSSTPCTKIGIRSFPSQYIHTIPQSKRPPVLARFEHYMAAILVFHPIFTQSNTRPNTLMQQNGGWFYSSNNHSSDEPSCTIWKSLIRNRKKPTTWTEAQSNITSVIEYGSITRLASKASVNLCSTIGWVPTAASRGSGLRPTS